jgi:hypothetical protein
MAKGRQIARRAIEAGIKYNVPPIPPNFLKNKTQKMNNIA